MGKNTKNYRQSAQSMSGNRGAQTYAKINRLPWHGKVINYFKYKIGGRG